MSDQPRLPAPAAGTVRALLQSEAIKSRFQEVLKDRAPQFIASLASLVYSSTALKTCEPNSVIVSALKAAALDLPIEPALGFAAIVPYSNVAQFQIQWKGYVQLALRTNQYSTINVREIYEGMVRGVDPFTGEIKRGEKTGEKVIGYFAYFRLLNGFEKSEYMTVEEVHAHGVKYSKSYGKGGSKWQTDPDAMGRKTVVKKLLTRWGILSIQMQEAVKAESVPDETPEEKQAPVSDVAVSQDTSMPPYSDNAAADADIVASEAEHARKRDAVYGNPNF